MRKVVELLDWRSSDARARLDASTSAGCAARLLGAADEARQTLAAREGRATIDFVTGAVEQGEKVIVFSCFEEPMQKLADGVRRVRGRADRARRRRDKRQALVDRFQQDDSVRVFLANIIAGGIGLEPDRRDAGRVQRSRLGAGQPLAGRGPRLPHRPDAHGQRHLPGRPPTRSTTSSRPCSRSKAALVSADRRRRGARAGALAGDVLDELQRALHAVSSGSDRRCRRQSLTIEWSHAAAEGGVGRLPRDAITAIGQERPTSAAPTDVEAFKRALERLVKVLSGSPARRFRIAEHVARRASSTKSSSTDADVTCTCPGFEYRGQCRHARDVKAALASGQEVPAPYAEVR